MDRDAFLLTDYLTVFSLQIFAPHLLPFLFVPEHGAQESVRELDECRVIEKMAKRVRNTLISCSDSEKELIRKWVRAENRHY